MSEEVRKTRALLGFMGEQEAINFLKSMCKSGGKTDHELTNVWQAAKSAVDVLPPQNLSAEVLDIDGKFRGQLDTVASDPLFPEATQQKRWSFKLVEIDKLVCFQQYVIVDYAEEIAGKQDLSDLGRLIEFCLPSKRGKRPMAVVSTPQEYTMLSSSQDLRVLGPGQMQDPVTKRTVFGFGVGWGLPFIQVVKFKDRYFLRNGYHRVYEIRKRGVRHVPCILIEGVNFGDTGAAKPGFFGEQSLMSAKPPTFADFFSDEIAPPLQMNPFTKVVRVRAEESVLPVKMQPPPQLEEQKVPPAAEDMAGFDRNRHEDFKIVKEDWNTYKLEDGTILKVRQLLTRIAKQPQIVPSQPNMSIEMSNLLTAIFPPPNLKGAPSTRPYPPQELSQSIIQPGMKYEPIQEVMNEYVTGSGIKLLFQIASLNVSKTSKFGPAGDPIYLVNAQTNVQIVQPGPAE